MQEKCFTIDTGTTISEQVAKLLEGLGRGCRELIESSYMNTLRELIELQLHGLEDLARDLEALANPQRIRIIALLARSRKPLPLCLLAAMLSIDRRSLFHHLRILRERGIVEEHKDGKFVFLRLNEDSLERVIRKLMNLLSGDEVQRP